MIQENKPIRILNVLGVLDRGGAETMVMNYYRHMDRNKIQFDFVVHSDHIGAYEEEVKFLGGRVWHIPRFKIYNLFSYLAAWKKLLAVHLEFHIIHAHMASTACLFIPIAKKYGIKVIVHAHNTRVTGSLIKQALERISFFPLRYMADYFFACSDEAAVFKFGKSILKNPRYQIWYNAIDFKNMSYSQESREKIRKMLSIGDNELLLGNIGRLTPQKNQIYLLKIFKRFVESHPSAKLLILGEGELRQSLTEEIQKMGLADSVMMPGAVNNVTEYLSAMDVFVLPSLWEGLGMAAIEAQVNGLYCLVSDEVPQLAKISGNIDFVPLNVGVETWCRKIVEAPHIDREDFHLENNDYDIEKAAKKAERFYLSV